jgi:hypothetical protein
VTFPGPTDPDTGHAIRSGGLVSCHSACASAASWGGEHVAGPFDEEQAADAGSYFLGGYEGMVTNGNAFGPFFVRAVSRAAGNPSDVYYSTVTP